MNRTRQDSTAGAAVYNRFVLNVYDRFVLEFCNRYVWRCPSSGLLEHYNQHVTAKHLDVGVGTGYFLDKCRFPALPSITLADLNPTSLEVAARRTARYNPEVKVIDVLKPLALGETFDSIGVNYLLHCLPGKMADKRSVFERLKGQLNPGGVLFGSTILGRGVEHNLLGRGLMRIYNRAGIFTNEQDSLDALEKNLSSVFTTYQLEQCGRVAIFSAYG